MEATAEEKQKTTNNPKTTKQTTKTKTKNKNKNKKQKQQTKTNNKQKTKNKTKKQKTKNKKIRFATVKSNRKNNGAVAGKRKLNNPFIFILILTSKFFFIVLTNSYTNTTKPYYLKNFRTRSILIKEDQLY